jgi:predicted ester cyclase
MATTRWLFSIVVLALGCGPRVNVSDDPSSAPGASKSAGRFSYETYIDAVYNAHNPDALERFFSPNVVVHGLAPGVPDKNGIGYLKDLAKNLIAAFPDVHMTVEDVVQEGNRLSARVVLEGTHKGEFIGIAPTGRKVKVANFAMYRLDGDKIAEVWSLVDLAQLELQLTEKR